MSFFIYYAYEYSYISAPRMRESNRKHMQTQIMEQIYVTDAATGGAVESAWLSTAMPVTMSAEGHSW